MLTLLVSSSKDHFLLLIAIHFLNTGFESFAGHQNQTIKLHPMVEKLRSQDSNSLCSLGYSLEIAQCAKNVLFFSPQLVDFAVRLVDYIHHLPDGQVYFIGDIFEEIQITEVL